MTTMTPHNRSITIGPSPNPKKAHRPAVIFESIARMALEQRTTWLGLCRHFFLTVSAKPQGKLLLSIWAGFLTWSLSLRSKRSSIKSPPVDFAAGDFENAPKKGEAAAAAVAKRGGTADLKALLKIAQPHMLGTPGIVLAAYIATLMSRILITVRLADLSGELAGKMGLRNWSAMFLLQVDFAFVCFAGALVTFGKASGPVFPNNSVQAPGPTLVGGKRNCFGKTRHFGCGSASFKRFD